MGAEDNKKFLSNQAYDVLKYIAQIILPAFGTLYFALSGIWGFPNGEQVVGTIAAFNVFIGVVVGVSNVSYNNSEAKYDGAINVEEDEDGKKFLLEFHGDPYDIDKQTDVVLQVKHI